MNTLEIPDRNLITEIPSHWDEMTEHQVFYCLSHILRVGESPLEGRSDGSGSDNPDRDVTGGVLSAQIKCFYHLANIRRSWRSIFLEKIMPAEWTLEKNANATTLAQQLTAFMFTGKKVDVSAEASAKVELNYNTVLNHFQEVKVPSWEGVGGGFFAQLLHGPTDLLADISFGEFRAAIEEMNDYFSVLNEERDLPSRGNAHHQLSRFIACLYRPQRKNYHELSKSEAFDGQRREPFNRNRIEANARIIDRMHPVHRTAILLWFTYCIHYIQTEDLIISGRTISLKVLFPKPREGDSPLEGGKGGVKSTTGSGWTSILYQIAKEGLFGNAGATDKAGLFDILLYMYDQHMENKRIKAKYSKKTKK